VISTARDGLYILCGLCPGSSRGLLPIRTRGVLSSAAPRGTDVSSIDDLLFQLPDFVLADHPARDSIERAIADRDGPALRSALSKTTTDNARSLLTAIALYFEGDADACQRALGGIANSRLGQPALFVAASVATDQRRLHAAMKAINSVQRLAAEERSPHSAEILQHAARYALALELLAEETMSPSRGSEPVRRAGPTCYVVSYPRSGNTMVMNALSCIFRVPAYSVFPNDGYFFSRFLYDASDASVAAIKDHVYRGSYLKDRVIYLIRDGRDASVSLCRFLEPGNHMNVEDDERFGAFLIATDQSYLFGSWAANVRLALKAQAAGADILISRYEDVRANPDEYFRIADFVAPDHVMSRDRAEVVSHVERGKSELTGPEWGFDGQAVPVLFKTWNQHRGESNWRTVFGPAARKVFHDQGGTELLMQFGYETDPDWWRNG
jgi:hypothetical protein